LGTDITPPAPPTGGEEGGAPPSAPPEPPVAAPTPTAAGPAAPVVGGAATGATEYDPQQVEQAMGLHRALNDPIGSGEAMTRLVQRHGQLPDWFTWDHAVDAMRNYAQFISEMDAEQQGGGGAEGVPLPPGDASTGAKMPPQEFEALLQRHVAPLQQEIMNLRQERSQDVGTQRAQMISSAVDAVAEGLPDAARDTLLNNVVYGLRAAIDQGQQVDFTPKAIQQYTNDMLTHLRSLSLAQQQQQIEEHRQLAPQTRAPNGSPTGTPVPRGLAGSASRAMELARQWEAGLPPGR